MTVVDYIREEVDRQGHDTTTLDGLQRVGWMLQAWVWALNFADERRPTVEDVIKIGKLVEPSRNMGGVRNCYVQVGGRVCPPPQQVKSQLAALFLQRDALTPWEFYRALLEIHPFRDGNGRSAKVIVNWLLGTLAAPVFPPDDFWGHPIRNP